MGFIGVFGGGLFSIKISWDYDLFFLRLVSWLAGVFPTNQDTFFEMLTGPVLGPAFFSSLFQLFAMTYFKNYIFLNPTEGKMAIVKATTLGVADHFMSSTGKKGFEFFNILEKQTVGCTIPLSGLFSQPQQTIKRSGTPMADFKTFIFLNHNTGKMTIVKAKKYDVANENLTGAHLRGFELFNIMGPGQFIATITLPSSLTGLQKVKSPMRTHEANV
jgi:hypothetical protein